MATATSARPPTPPPTSPSPPRSCTSPSSAPPKHPLSPPTHSKPCTLCFTPLDVLVRCRIDVSQTWHFVCPGKCWRNVSGGIIDGPDKPHYQYGGMWKNKHAGVSAKKPKHKGRKGKREIGVGEWSAERKMYKNDRVRHTGTVWLCRRSHESGKENMPGVEYRYWKEEGGSASSLRGKDDELEGAGREGQ